ncbi:MAG TPA: hypothetical protein VJB96_02055, partial [Patescibacteria group bacterium]|nr:hypothetical protein [Patescibacteria group bacterium]
YPIDALFLLVGTSLLLATFPLMAIFFAALIALSTIPSVFSIVGTSYGHRSALMYPFLTILISYGIVETIRKVKTSLRPWVLGGIVFGYILVTANFVYLYFFRFPYYNSESFGLSQRLYSRYTALAEKHDTPVIHLTEAPELYLRNYVFYRNAVHRNTVEDIRNRFLQKNYAWENATFTKTCPTKEEIDKGETTYILSETSPCKDLFIKRPMTAIPTLSDGGTLYMIFNDRVCSDYALSAYPTGYTLDDFAIEKLSEKRFCERFIIRYTQPLYLPQDRTGAWITPKE